MVKNLLDLLSTRQTSILSGASIIASTLLISKILGLVRDRLLAHLFPPDVMAVFFAAFGLTDFVFQLLIFGALSVAFIPVFTDWLETKGREEAFKLAAALLNCSMLLFLAVAVFIYIFAPVLVGWFIAPGFSEEQKLQTADLTRIIIFGQILLIVGTFFMSTLQSFQRFIIPAIAGIFYNLGIILGIVLLSSTFGIAGAAWGVVIGAGLHILIQLPFVASVGLNWSALKTIFHPGVKEVLQLIGVRSIGLAAELINERVVFALATLITTSSATYLTLAQRLQVAPIGLFGATIAQAALPVLSSERARGRIEEFKITLLTTLHQILFLALPATAILIVLRIPAVRLVFGASQFDWEATVITGATLAWLAVGLSAQAVSLLLVRAFYALKDTKTPVMISLITVLTNISISYYLVNFLKLDVWGLGIALSVSNILSAMLLFIMLHKKVGGFMTRAVINPLLKMLMATVIMGAALYIPIKLLDQVIFDTTRTVNLIILTVLASAFALSIYVLLVWFMKVKELHTFIELLRKFGKIQNNIRSEEIVHEPETP